MASTTELFTSFFLFHPAMWSFPHTRSWSGGTQATMQVRGKKILVYPRDGGITSSALLETYPNCVQQYLELEELEVACLYISARMVEKLIALVERQSITKIVLRTCQFPSSVLRALLQMHHFSLKCPSPVVHFTETINRQLRHLEIHKTSKLDRTCMEIICSTLMNLESLTFNINQGLEFLFPNLHMLTMLQVLNLNGCHLERNDAVVDCMARYFLAATSYKPRNRRCLLKHVSLKCCRLTDESIYKIVIAMRQLSQLRRLDLVGNSCCSKGLEALGKLLQSPTMENLQILDLSYQLSSDFGDIGTFADSLCLNTTLTVLRLAGNNLGDANVCRLADSLARNSGLQDLDLSANSIGELGVQSLIRAMHQNQALTTLSLKYNSFADLSSWEAVLQAHNYSLQRLNHSCRIEQGTGNEIVSYYLRLNQGGRIILKREEEKTPLGLWPLVLERSSSAMSENTDAIFFILRNSAVLYRTANFSTA